jgi:uncharacterized protein (UPF0332 family)
MNHIQLISVALDLAASPNPTDAALRRSISTLYYSVFHKLMHFVAVTLAPGAEDKEHWKKLYRSLDHGTSKNRLEAIAKSEPALYPFSQLFTELLNLRHKADYDPSEFDSNQRQVIDKIEQTLLAFIDFDKITSEKRVDVAVTLLLPDRNDNGARRKS